MLGGFAVHFHGYSRVTKDVDMYVEDTPDNRVQLGLALEELGIAPREIGQRMQFIAGWSTLSLKNGFPLDIMMEVKGLEDVPFSECLESAQTVTVHGVTIPFLHLNHLIRSKQAANRPKDQVDLIALAEIQELRKKHGLE
jgi:hypothetical protein